MQVSGSYSPYNPATSHHANSSSKSDTSGSKDEAFYKSLADYSSPDNTMFQNLIKRDDVEDNIVKNDDGTYSWKDNADGSDGGFHEWLAHQFIDKQNGVETRSMEPGQVSDYSMNDLAKFRQISGYNIVRTGDVYFVADDNGNPPTDDRAQMYRDIFDSAKFGQTEEGGRTKDLSWDDIKDTALGFKDGAMKMDQSTTAIDAILDVIDKYLT